MAYPVRQFEPDTIYFITSRTMQSRLLMSPTPMTNELIGGILARAVRQCEVELFAYIFTSNHFHAMVRAPSAIAMSKFMQRLQSNIAVKVGRLVDWRGRFFARRYSAEPIVDEGAQVERLRYILSHGVKEGLVATVRAWPGLSCAGALLEGGRASVHRWRNWTRRWKMEMNDEVSAGRFAEECPHELETLSLATLPCWARLSASERIAKVSQMVADIDAAALNKSDRAAAAIAAQDPHGRPRLSKFTPRPKAHASSKEAWIAAVRRYAAFLDDFRSAAREWLAGHFEVRFPPHCFRPPTWATQ